MPIGRGVARRAHGEQRDIVVQGGGMVLGQAKFLAGRGLPSNHCLQPTKRPTHQVGGVVDQPLRG